MILHLYINAQTSYILAEYLTISLLNLSYPSNKLYKFQTNFTAQFCEEQEVEMIPQ